MRHAYVGFGRLPFVERISQANALIKGDVSDSHGSTERHVGIVRHAELQTYLPQPTTDTCLIHTSASATKVNEKKSKLHQIDEMVFCSSDGGPQELFDLP